MLSHRSQDGNPCYGVRNALRRVLKPIWWFCRQLDILWRRILLPVHKNHYVRDYADLKMGTSIVVVYLWTLSLKTQWGTDSLGRNPKCKFDRKWVGSYQLLPKYKARGGGYWLHIQTVVSWENDHGCCEGNIKTDQSPKTNLSNGLCML